MDSDAPSLAADKLALELEVAGQVGETSGWVTKRLKELRVELERLASS